MDLGYPFTGKDMADLRHFSGIFQEWGIMALWDEYLNLPDDKGFNKKHGWTVFQFTRQLPRIMDVKGWKDKAREYELKMAGPYPKEIVDLFNGPHITNAKAV